MALDRRTQSLRWRELVALWLRSERGLQVTPRRYLETPANKRELGFVDSHIHGVSSVVNCHAERDFLAGLQVDRAKSDALAAGLETYFSIQLRQNRQVQEALVFTDLECLSIVLTRLQKLERLEQLEAGRLEAIGVQRLGLDS